MTGDRKNVEIGQIFFQMLGINIIEKGNMFDHYFKVIRENISGEQEDSSFVIMTDANYREIGEHISKCSQLHDLELKMRGDSAKKRIDNQEEIKSRINFTTIYLVSIYGEHLQRIQDYSNFITFLREIPDDDEFYFRKNKCFNKSKFYFKHDSQF